MKKLNPLEIYLNNVEYVWLENTNRFRQNKNYRDKDYMRIKETIDVKRILSFVSMMFNVNVSHKSNKQLQLWLNEIHERIKQGNIPKRQIMNYKRYIVGEIRDIIRRHIESKLDEFWIEYNPQHFFLVRFYRDFLKEINEVAKEVCIELILFW